MAHSGRVIFAAAAVMIAVFFSFALAEPLPPKEMGHHSGCRRTVGRHSHPLGSAAGSPAPDRPRRMVVTHVATSSTAQDRLLAQLSVTDLEQHSGGRGRSASATTTTLTPRGKLEFHRTKD